jgi:methionyl-tRNA formyltransferase
VKISILCTDRRHPVVSTLIPWQDEMRERGHDVQILFNKRELVGGDILFLVSCGQMISKADREKFRASLVLHASDLPRCRGWSPHIWAILSGASEITVCLLEAVEPVDSGAIWLKTSFVLEGHELFAEINARLFAAELRLMEKAVEEFENITPLPQQGEPGLYMAKRIPEDSRLDPNKTLAEQFDLLRIADPDRYPAFIDLRGKRYLLKIEKVKNEE